MKFRRMLVLGLLSLSVVAISGAVPIGLGPWDIVKCPLKKGVCLVENLRSGPGVVARSLEPTEASSAAAAGPGFRSSVRKDREGVSFHI